MGKRHKPKPRPRGTGKPDPSKDRSAHEAARGQKKPQLRDLSRIKDFDPHILDMLDELDNQTDRGAALVAASMVQVALVRLMRCRIVAFEDCEETLFDGEGAPLGTFAACIKVARGMGVIGIGTQTLLNAIRNIRNQFAHSPLKIDFNNALIAEEIDKLLQYQPGWKPEFSEQRSRYIGTCIALIDLLEKATQQHTPDRIPIWTG